MANQNDAFLRRLLATFLVEAGERLEAMSSGLIELEKASDKEKQAETIERIFREAHSLKGAARAVNLTEVEAMCQALESVFFALKNRHLAASLALFDQLQQALAALGSLLAAEGQANAQTPKHVIMALIRQLEDALEGAGPDRVEPPLTPQPAAARPPASMLPAASPVSPGVGSPLPTGSPTMTRVHTAQLDAMMRQAEELLAPQLAAGQHARELRETGMALAAWKKERGKIQPVVRSMERLPTQPGKTNAAARGQPDLKQLLDYLEIENQLLKTVEERLANLGRAAEHDYRALSGMVDDLRQGAKAMYMLPFSTFFEGLPRLVRELARDQGKQVELVILGDEIEIDRRILEEMRDALTHLIRNCVDHGIEMPALRAQESKPLHGTLTIAVSQQDSGKVEILVADDGAGVDVAKVKAAAGRLDLIPAEALEKLDDREARTLIFHSGITTSPLVTDLSGRGLGLAIVREKVERLGGGVALDTHPNAGTSFRITLPITLATFRGVLVRAGDQLFIIPAASVERVVRVAGTDIRTVGNRETIMLGGQTISLARLSDVLEISRPKAEFVDSIQAVVLGTGLDRIAFRVDAVLEEQEVLVKGLGPQLARVRNIVGASVLGTGQVVPVLNVTDLLKSAKKTVGPHVAPAAEETTKQSILVVEDSITSRVLLKNILEAAGYNVTTAVDGVDAYATLKREAFDLIVSDVEMPRMDGFDLTAKVRADKQLEALPVVLVTALGSREHRERGIDVGANAYIVKSSFDQSNLLEVIGRLI
jgi:two-component system chemotaxis sensor kinase CheA